MTAAVTPSVLPSNAKLASAAVVVIVGGLLTLLLGIAVIFSQNPTTTATTGTLNDSAIPAAYVPWVIRAGSLCAAIPPAIIAAQDQVESDWNPHAVSPAGAEGIAQFLPSTFPTWSRNDDGTGHVSPFNPDDEIMAQGRYDCSLAALAQKLINSGGASGTATSLALAAYNAGPGAVEAAHGVPADAASYVHQIEALAASRYSVSTPVTVSGQGLVAVSAAETALGTPYHYGGSCADPRGSDPAGWCDCSSLTQMAWRAAGVNLPRTTYQQVHAGTPVPDIADLEPGDLIFIPGSDGSASNPGHVGIYAGGGLLINAPYTGQVVQFARVGTWASQIVAIRRP
jgi:cell wall-associated NlpC family hydrolase